MRKFKLAVKLALVIPTFFFVLQKAFTIVSIQIPFLSKLSENFSPAKRVVFVPRKAELSFIAIGDIGGKTEWPHTTDNQLKVASEVANIAEQHDVQFVVGLGDNFYSRGVLNVHSPRFHATFEQVYNQSSLVNIPWFMLAGNHDYMGNVTAQIEYTKHSSRWRFPYFFHTHIYTIPESLDTVQVILLDTKLICENRAGLPESKEQLWWLENQLKKSRALYVIVCGHEPVFSIGIWGSSFCLKSRLKPLLEKYHVTAYLSGHDHNFQYIVSNNSSHGVQYFVNGAGKGGDMRETHRKTLYPGQLKFFYGRESFVLLQATTNHLRVTVINVFGDKLFNVTIQPRKYIPDAL